MDDLRQLAITKLKTNENLTDFSRIELEKIIEELNIHQIELELQADELKLKTQAEEKLKAEYYSLFNNAPIGYLVCDQNGIIKKINQNAADIFNRNKEALKESVFIRLLAGESMGDFFDQLEQTKQGRQIVKNQFLLNCQPSKWVELHSNLLENNQYIFTVQDVTKEREAQNQIEQQNKALTELSETQHKLFSIISHDLRSPFQALLGYSDLLLLNYDDFPDQRRKEFIRILNQNIKSTFNLVENILMWTRSQSDKIELTPEKIDISKLTDDVVAYLLPVANAKHISVHSAIHAQTMVFADKCSVEIILRNLISNAIKFTAKNGSVSISAEKTTKNHIKTCIKDSGIGIPEDKLARIFESGTATTPGTANEKGTGIGLAICKDFVYRNNGEISAKSKAESGSEFCFTLPVP